MLLGVAEYLSEAYLKNVSLITNSFSFESGAFWKLFISGQWNVGAHSWYERFSALYLLHLMVMSGTQVSALDLVSRKFFWFVVPHSKHVCASRYESVFRVLWLAVFVVVSGLAAPIVRGSILSVLGIFLHRWQSKYLIIASFLLHLVFFPWHLGELGFYLSWFAYLILFSFRDLKIPNTFVVALVSAVIFIVVDLMIFGNGFSFRSLVLCVLSNMIFCAFFEAALVPLAGYFIFFSLIFTILPFAPDFLTPIGKFLALWADPLVSVMVVGMKKLMYTDLL